MKTQNKKVLYVLDGYDEVVDALNDTKIQPGKIIALLLSQEQVVLTSRPHYIKDKPLTNSSNKSLNQVEMIGFLNEDIDRYINVFFQQSEVKNADFETEEDYAKTLKQFLNQNTSAKGMAHVPINLALICKVWVNNVFNTKATKELTLTALYSALILNLSLRYFKKSDSLSVKSSIRWSAISKKLPMWDFLIALAFQQMQRLSLVIEPEDIATVRTSANADDDVFYEALDFGLLKSMGNIESDIEEKPCYFIHLTFQEFLAAHYIVDQLTLKPEQRKQTKPGEDIEAFIKYHKYHSRYEIVWWFVAGLLHEQKKAEALEIFFHLLDDPETRDLVGLSHLCLTIRCMDECNLEVTEKTKESFIKDQLAQWVQQLLQRSQREEKALNTLLQYVFISPRVLTQSTTVTQIINKVKQTKFPEQHTLITQLSDQSSLPNALLEELLKITSNHENKYVKELAKKLELLNKPRSDLITKKVDLKKEDKSLRNIPVRLSKPAYLSDSTLRDLAARWENDADKCKIDEIIKLGQKPMLSDLEMKYLNKNSNHPTGSVRRAVVAVLWKQPNPNFLLLIKIARKEKSWVIKKDVVNGFSQQPDLSNFMLEQLRNIASDDPEKEVRSAFVEVLNKQLHLPDALLEIMVNIALNDKDGSVKKAAMEVLFKQSYLSEFLLEQLIKKPVHYLMDPDIEKLLNKQPFSKLITVYMTTRNAVSFRWHCMK